MRAKAIWTVVKELEENGVLVEVSKSDAYRPRYAIRVGRRGDKGLVPFLPLFIEGKGKITVNSPADTAAKLMKEAAEFVREEAQKAEDEYIEQRIARELKQVEREGKKRRPSGYKQHGRSAA